MIRDRDLSPGEGWWREWLSSRWRARDGQTSDLHEFGDDGRYAFDLGAQAGGARLHCLSCGRS